jgi:hypothetical protein
MCDSECATVPAMPPPSAAPWLNASDGDDDDEDEDVNAISGDDCDCDDGISDVTVAIDDEDE